MPRAIWSALNNEMHHQHSAFFFFKDMILSKAATTHWVTRKTQLFKKSKKQFALILPSAQERGTPIQCYLFYTAKN